ncbi:DsbA family oxidoreductase [Jannaschia aquimarina]|uniref:DSBA-like thioredoxin domain protein n=1 Tax=Jannaschia aquimarina TaxID=935700 RepID=A0A0D1EJD9_9RHOB|nr:DsbA family oxidoreductase [Jannaschia aquimarina]KIT15920.1 DSBA-like thioredoxin domain protein [Jannaschia aquimarina]SNS97832.1 Predicted dithiol-disulfide isomerase, DsbA family [Jannaschia aquimarina]
MLKLDIISDPICPWCYIGKTRLFRALEARPDHPFTIEWHPFQLNPDMPEGGMDRATYLERKFGGKEGAVRAYLPVVEAAEDSGLTLDLEGIARTPNTLDAHRLIHWAGLEGRQTAVVHGLFAAYFEAGRDIGDPQVLADIAEGCGMDRAMTERLLATDADREEIRTRDAHARERGVTGVPTFVIANQAVVAGAQPAETWQQIIDDLQRQIASQAAGG